MIVAFTGSSRQLTIRQKEVIANRILELPLGTTVITGACVGVDAYVAQIAASLDFHVITVVPANRRRVDPDYREFADTLIEMSEGTSYRDRNTEMVRLGHDLVIGYPDRDTDGRDIGSGTWMTIRIAKRMGRRVEVHPLCEIGC